MGAESPWSSLSNSAARRALKQAKGEAARSTAAVGTAATGTAAVGAQTTRWFGLHSAEQLINTVHRVEASFHLSRADRAFRLAVTVADQAIQGEGSV